MANAASVAHVLENAVGSRSSVPRRAFDDYTKSMRADGVLSPSKRGRGASKFSTTDVVNTAIGCLLGPTNSKAATTVKNIRAMELNTAFCQSRVTPDEPFDHAESFRKVCQRLRPFIPDARNYLSLGLLLDAVVNAMRGGLLATSAPTVKVEFYDLDHSANLYVFFDKHGYADAMCLSFGDKREKGESIERIYRIDGRVFESLAAVLGPPDPPS